MSVEIRTRPGLFEERAQLGQLKLRSTLGWGEFVEELSVLPEAAELGPELIPRTFVATIDGEIAGFATLLSGTGGTAELEELFVEPDLWRTGVGRQLIAEAVKRAQASGSHSIHVVGNRRARAFYEAVGFVLEGEVPTTFEPGCSMRMQIVDWEVRSPHASELDEVAAVWHASALSMDGAPPDVHSASELRSRLYDELQDGWVLYVAATTDRIVGMLAIKPASALLDQLFILPAEQGKGIGRTLLAKAKHEMPTGFNLKTVPANYKARRFYEKEGVRFDRAGVHPKSGSPVLFFAWDGA